MSDATAQKGDWIEVNVIGGGPNRRGQILEVIGAEGHEHYRVRWDEQHESLHYPAEGTQLLHEAPDGTLTSAASKDP
jgi:Domain of unknown function (DUF1918)